MSSSRFTIPPNSVVAQRLREAVQKSEELDRNHERMMRELSAGNLSKAREFAGLVYGDISRVQLLIHKAQNGE